MTSALRDVRVVELGDGIASAFGARLLGDFGADVMKVEAPEGSRIRALGPRMPPAAGAEPIEHSALFEYLNWNKRSVVVDPATDRDRLDDLVGRADIVIVGDDIAAVKRWTPDLDGLRTTHPDLIVVTVTPFGRTGPRSDWTSSELILQALSGLMAISGLNDREPLMRGLRQTSYTSGLNVAYTALFGYLSRIRGGAGCLVDIAMSEVVSSELVFNLPTYAFLGAIQGRRTEVKDPLSSGMPLRSADSWVTVQLNTLTTVAQFGDLLREPRLQDERFATAEGRLENAEELTALLEGALASWQGRDFFEAGSAAGVLTGIMQTAAQLLTDPQMAARGTFVEVAGTEAATGGPWRFPSRSANLSSTPASVERRAPRLGQHTHELETESAA
jgi:crotonobetainyl-CoA:carnitine CoA-transferase CaiB-like acyl-CoA transferase